MTDDSMYARISRIESDLDHIKEIIDPLPLSVNNSLQKQAEISERLAVANERIATHLEESKRAWVIIESPIRVCFLQDELQYVHLQQPIAH